MKQGRLPGVQFKIRISYGGSKVQGSRKIKRPFSPKKFLHLVFRSDLASKGFSMINNRAKIELELYALAFKYEINLKEYTNAGNHLHLLVKAPCRKHLQNFLKSFARRVSCLMVGPGKKFWTSLVYSRIVEWGRDVQNVSYYFIRNFLETEKQIPYSRIHPPPFMVLG